MLREKMKAFNPWLGVVLLTILLMLLRFVFMLGWAGVILIGLSALTILLDLATIGRASADAIKEKKERLKLWGWVAALTILLDLAIIGSANADAVKERKERLKLWGWVVFLAECVMLFGVFPLMGLPGAIVLMFTAPLVRLDLGAMGAGAWAAALVMTVFCPLFIPIAFGLARLTVNLHSPWRWMVFSLTLFAAAVGFSTLV